MKNHQQKIKEIEVKTALHYHKKAIPCNWDLNIYRGCSHGCKYCFARYSHKYLQSNNFFDELYVKTNIAEVLDNELRKKRSWKSEQINIGGVTDSYQNAEARYKIVPDILKIMIKYKNPVLLASKSTLMLRDFDLIKELASITTVDIATTITTLDINMQQIIEPGASPSLDRLKMLSKFKEAGCKTTVLLMPIIPYLTSSRDNLSGIFKLTRENNIDNIITGTLYLKGSTKKCFMEFIRTNFPQIYNNFITLYKGAYLPKSYRDNLHTYLKELRIKYDYYKRSAPKRSINNQPSLFD